ncbi:MAG: efflux RND transporter periplasmic adaptor subunit [Thalassobaculaceae bacterium]|nr:efflux RND transporter periplasmic adaptor subunit [Thalassobaculaceae bacterium]
MDADTAAVVAPVVAAPVGDRVQPDPGLVSSVISESSRNISDGAVAVADTGWQVAEGVYYLGGELIESGRIIGVSTMQILGLLSSDGVQDRQRLGEQGVAGVWWGTSAAKTAETTAVSAPTMPVSPTAPLPVVAGPRHTVGGDRALAARQSRPNAAITPASLSASDGKEAGPETPALAADQGTVADDTCSWDFRRDRKPVTLSGEDVAVLSKLGLMDESAQRLPDGTIFLPKVTQRLLEVRTAFTCKGTVSTTRRLVGHVIANPTSSGLVQAEQDGRIEGGEFGFPVIGQRVEKGQLLGYLLPILSSKERAELQGEIALVRGKIAEQELAIARTRELPLLPFRDGRILSMRIELSKLRAQRDALIDGLSARQPLTASASGVVARSEVRVGQVVEERQLLWEIADTSDLWIEADSFGSQTNFATTGSTAETQDGQTMHLTLKGLGLSTDGAQSSPVQFRVDGIPDGVRIGQQVVVNVRELAQIEGVMAPRSALVRRSNGEMTVWVAKGPEQYEPRKVKWTPAGSHVAIIEAGVTEGVRVVVSGATLLSEVR